MDLIRAVLTVPSHMVPGGMPQPDLKLLGFKSVVRKKTAINITKTTTTTTSFIFSEPKNNCGEDRFDIEIERVIWQFAKGTPYQIDKFFCDGTPEKHHRYRYINNKLVCEPID